jgi:hypothetical protein
MVDDTYLILRQAYMSSNGRKHVVSDLIEVKDLPVNGSKC